MAENKNKIVEKLKDLVNIYKELNEEYTISQELELSYTRNKYHVCIGGHDYYNSDLEKALDEAIENFENDIYNDAQDCNDMWEDYVRDKYREWASY